MPKTPQLWKPKDSGTTSAISGHILTQSSDTLTTQAGDRLILTETLLSGKLATSWAIPAMGSTAWKPKDSGTTTTLNTGIIRTTQLGDTRITQDGNTRILNESIVSGKTPTVWRES